MIQLIKNLFEKIGIEIRRKSSPPMFHFEEEKEFNDLYMLAQEKTDMLLTDNKARKERHYVLQQLMHKVASIDGDIAECGCWKGCSAYQIATIVQKRNFEGKFYLFDSFEGLSKFSAEDKTDMVKNG